MSQGEFQLEKLALDYKDQQRRIIAEEGSRLHFIRIVCRRVMYQGCAGSGRKCIAQRFEPRHDTKQQLGSQIQVMETSKIKNDENAAALTGHNVSNSSSEGRQTQEMEMSKMKKDEKDVAGLTE